MDNEDRWEVRPLRGKHYGTEVGNGTHLLRIWLGFRDYTDDEVSVRELDDGWGSGYEKHFDHVESVYDYEAAVAICDALNKLEEQWAK